MTVSLSDHFRDRPDIFTASPMKGPGNVFTGSSICSFDLDSVVGMWIRMSSSGAYCCGGRPQEGQTVEILDFI